MWILACLLSVASPQDAGAIAFGQACLDATTDAVVLNIAAHPDDEAARTLVLMRHKYGVRTVTLYSTCGGGGQNVVGREVGAKLAAIRVRETLAAAGHTGTEVRWLGFPDFGYSKSMEETLAVWGQDELLGRMAVTVAEIAPDVVLTNHTLDRGHGHHRASRWAIGEVSEQWRKRGRNLPVYERAGGATSFTVNPSEVDNIRGATFARQAHQGLLEHATQGPWGPHNPMQTRSEGWRQALPPVEDGEAGEHPLSKLPSVFDEPSFQAALERRGVPADELRRELDAFETDRSRIAHVMAARKLLPTLREMRADVRDSASASARLDRRIDALERVVAYGSGVVMETFVVDSRISPGGKGRLRVTVRGPGVRKLVVRCGDASVDADSVEQAVQARIQQHLAEARQHRQKGDSQAARRAVQAALRLRPSHPQATALLAELPRPEGRRGRGRAGGNAAFAGFRGRPTDSVLPEGWVELPIQAPAEGAGDDPFAMLTGTRAFVVQSEFELDGLPVSLERRIDVPVAPRLELSWARDVVCVPAGRGPWQRVVSLEVSWFGDDVLAGPVQLRHPEGLEVRAIPAEVRLSREQPRTRVLIRIAGDGDRLTGRAEVSASIASAERVHVEVQPMPVKVADDLRVGLVRGPDDTMHRFLEDIGVPFDVLDETALAVADLEEFSTIVLDIRAYHHRPDLANHRERLLQFVKNGGRAVSFYHKPGEWNARAGKPLLAPFPLRVGRGRVSEEDAAVEFLAPDHALLTTPHEITLADFEDWVQERGLNFPSEYDPAWEPLLSMHDTGEDPLVSGLLYTRYGRGDFVYCSLGLYRQLRRGHLGGARLTLNLLTK